VATAGCGAAAPPAPPQPIPAENAAQLEELLQQADRQFKNGECDELEGTLERVSQGVDKIPNAEIDQRLLASLDTGTDRLTELAGRCEPREEVTVTETSPPPTAVPTQTVPTTPVPTQDTSTGQTDTEQKEPDKEQSEPSKPEEDEQQKPDQGSKPDPKPPKEDPCQGGDPRC
jgi:hypothetical protein